MKLTLIHLALIVIGVLMLVNLGYSVKEGLVSHSKKKKTPTEHDEEDKDKYILKTQIVPPVCPKCPDVTVCPNNSTGMASQPFVSKDYASGYNVAHESVSGPITSAYEPRPILTDFSQF
jgi:hypothetical protein